MPQTGQPQAMNLLSQYNYNLPNLQQQAEQTQNTASQYQSAADLLPQQLKQAIEEKLNYNQDLISQKNQAAAGYFSAPAQARDKYQNIANPFERESLVSQATSNAYAPYATYGDILNQRLGSISDLVNTGTGAFNSAVTAQQNKASQAQSAYQNAISLAQWLYGVQHQNVGGYQATKDAQTKQTVTDLVDDIRKGATLNQVMQAYSTDLDPSQILQLYNTNSKYGPAKESSSQLEQIYGIKPSTATSDISTINTLAQNYKSGKLTPSQIPADIRAQVLQQASLLPSQPSLGDRISSFFGGL